MSDQHQTPAIGRIVHYVAFGTPGGEYPAGVHRAAIITAVQPFANGDVDHYVSLCVLNPTGIFFQGSIPFDPTGTQPGSWHFPEYVPPGRMRMPGTSWEIDHD